MYAIRHWSRFLLSCLAAVGLTLSAVSCEDLPLPPLGEAVHRNVFGECDLEVYVFRGLADIYSLGFNHLNARLQNEGINSVAENHTAWMSIGQRILERRNAGVLSNRLAFVGHSYGGDDAIRLAEMLRANGIDVDLLVLYDSTNPPPIPDNVARVVHFYQRTIWGDLYPWMFAGLPVQAEFGNDRTEIINMAVDFPTFGIRAFEVNHFNIDSSGILHDLTVEEILDVCSSAPAAYKKYELSAAIARSAGN